MLIGIAFKNDVERRWDVILAQIKELLFRLMGERKGQSAVAPTARRVAARVLERVLRDKALAAAALDAELERAAQLQPRDKGLATELTYGTLRVRPLLEQRLARHATRGLDKLDEATLATLLVAAYQNPVARQDSCVCSRLGRCGRRAPGARGRVGSLC